MIALKDLIDIELKIMDPNNSSIDYLKDKIVVISGLNSGEYILMLSDDLYCGSVKSAHEKDLIKIREATNKEKEFWFNVYDTTDLEVVPVRMFKEWLKKSLYEVKDSK